MITRALLAAILLLGASIPIGSAQAADKATLTEGRKATKICLTCHHFKKPKRKFGPHLVDLLGRPVASADDYKYSKALTALGGEWDEERLFGFLMNPAEYAPGNAMKFRGFRDEDKTRAAIAYLKARFYK